MVLKKFAVFGYPSNYGRYDYPSSKVYFWGIIEGRNRREAYLKLEFGSYWYRALSRDVFLYELKDGKLVKNYFPGIPILSPYTPKYKGGHISGVVVVPLKDILPEDLNVKPS